VAGKSKVVVFPGNRPIRAPLAWFCRLGSTGHKQLATLRAAGGLPIGRVVVDASVWEDMFGDPRRHEVRRTIKALEELQAVPDTHRASHFVGQTLAKAARHARDVAGLDLKAAQADKFGVTNPERLMKSLIKHASTLDRKHRVLENLLESIDVVDRAVPIVARRTKVERGSSMAGGRSR